MPEAPVSEMPRVETRFKGTPTPPKRVEVTMGAATGEPFPAGVIGANNGRIAVYDKDG